MTVPEAAAGARRWAAEATKKIYAPLDPHSGYEALPVTDGDEAEKVTLGHMQRLIENTS